MIKFLPFELLLTQNRELHLPIVSHSKKVTDGCVFVALPSSLPQRGSESEAGGEQYLKEVIEAKAGYIVLDKKHKALIDALPNSTSVNIVLVDSPRASLGTLAASFYGTDKNCPLVIGITGTNGKTTEAYLLEHLYKKLGYKVGILGTVEYRWPEKNIPAPLTTPGCLELHSILSTMQKDGVNKVFMEVSSHALDQERVAGINFYSAIFTNLTQDHLDYHATMEEYFATKSRLFFPSFNKGHGVLSCGASNADDPWGRKLLSKNPALIGFGLQQSPVEGTRHLKGEILALTPQGMKLSMEFEGEHWTMQSMLVGEFNALNLLGAQAIGLAMGLTSKDFQLLESFKGVPGRLERIENAQGLHIFVDYAHTPDALIKAQFALRRAGFKRLVTVFGCGGNRDTTKRPLMGKAVAKYSDVAVLTSDNPRHENPLAIMADVFPGLKGCPQIIEQPDRRLALKEALACLGADDALLIAGKGHETYQQIGDEKRPFSDQAILREYLA